MIVRDEHDVIVQHRPSDPSYGKGGGDGGDSSRSSGIMATFGSKRDMGNLYFVHSTSRGFVRHLHQSPHNDPSNFSRDQLIPLLSGFKASIENIESTTNYGYLQIIKDLLYDRFSKSTFKYFPIFGLCQNKDLLAPDTIWHWIVCGKFKWLYWYAPLGYLWQILHILYMTKIAPEREQNQTICMAYSSGLIKLWMCLHPNWEQSIKDYWCGWRNQCELADFIIAGIKKDQSPKSN